MRYAGFWRRLGAHLLDTLILNLAAWGLGEAIFGAMYGVYWLIARSQGATEIRAFGDAFSPVFEQVASVVVYLALATPYFVWLTYKQGRTWGKKPLRIRVVREDGGPLSLKQSAIRYVAYLASYATFGCGFLMAAFNPQKRCLHDLLAGTVSVIDES